MFIKILNPYVFYDEDMPERYMKHTIDVLSQGEKKKITFSPHYPSVSMQPAAECIVH